MLSENKDLELEKESYPKGGKGITHTGPHFQPPEAGRPEWRVFYGKVMFWCNVCGYWNLTHFTKKKKGVSVEGYLDKATINGHQQGIGKHSKKYEEKKLGSDDAKPSASIVSIPKPGVLWAAVLLDCK
eukprot:2004526-Ditylum_brightwellii.AAC.1